LLKPVRAVWKALWPPVDLRLETRVFLATTLLAGLFALFVFTPANLIQGLPLYHHVAVIGMGILALSMWAMARLGKKTSVVVFIIASLILLDWMHFTNGASMGSTIWIMPLALVFSMILLRGWRRLLLVFIYSVNLPFIILVEAFLPGWVTPYPYGWARLLDQLISVPLATLLTGFLMAAMTHALDEERGRSAAQEERLQELVRETARLALTDGLTGILNQRALRERLRLEMAEAVRHGHSLSVLIMDLDHFKEVNDRSGHQAGDEAICRVAQYIGDSIGPDDIAGRYGGEEFLLVLPRLDATGAVALAEKIRARVETAERAGATPFTLSVGVAQRHAETEEEVLFRRADRALYKAKDLGRNRVAVAD
jgi:diguanylate cyclase (GGDEF)-like protein